MNQEIKNIEKKKKNNDKLKERYNNDQNYREKKKRIAIEYHYNKKFTMEIPIIINKCHIFLYFN